MSSPREWWIKINALIINDQINEPARDGAIHVIEYRAYESAIKERDELKAENEKHRWRLLGAQVDPTIEALKAELGVQQAVAKKLGEDLDILDSRYSQQVSALKAEIKTQQDCYRTCGELRAEVGELKTTIANQCEELVEALGEVGIDVSGCYDFEGMCQQIGCLVHEVELEKQAISLDKMAESYRVKLLKLGVEPDA